MAPRQIAVYLIQNFFLRIGQGIRKPLFQPADLIINFERTGTRLVHFLILQKPYGKQKHEKFVEYQSFP